MQYLRCYNKEGHTKSKLERSPPEKQSMRALLVQCVCKHPAVGGASTRHHTVQQHVAVNTDFHKKTQPSHSTFH